MIDRINLKALSYMVLKELDPEIIEKLEHEDGPDTTDAVRNVIETETPMWVFYYVEECSEELTEPANQIPSVVPKHKFIDTAEEYADRDSGVIDLTNPASQDWMSEDPMSHPREAYNQRVDSIQSAIHTCLSEHTELSINELASLSEDISEIVDPLQWELNRVRNGDDNGKTSDARIAELYLATGPNAVVELLDEYADSEVFDSEVDRDVLESYKLTEEERNRRMSRLRDEIDD